MRYIIFGLFLLLISCTKDKDSQHVSEPIQPIKNSFVINDSLFYDNTLKEFSWSNISSIQKHENPMFSAYSLDKSQLLDCLDNESEILSVSYFSSIKQQNGLATIVLLVSTMETKVLVLVTTHNGIDIVSCVQLTSNWCDVVDETEEREEVWCETKKASIVNPDKLKLTYVFTKEFFYGDYSKYDKDSIISTYVITQGGKLNLVKCDSFKVNL